LGPLRHAAIGAATAAAVYALGGRAEGAGGAFLSGVLIDADHLLDYYLAEGTALDLESLSKGLYFRKAGRALVLLHGYELAILMWIVLRAAGRPRLGAGICAGAMTHLLSDIRYYRFSLLAYSLIYRGMNGFRLGAMKTDGLRKDR
jgi:hypothetical protein